MISAADMCLMFSLIHTLQVSQRPLGHLSDPKHLCRKIRGAPWVCNHTAWPLAHMQVRLMTSFFHRNVYLQYLALGKNMIINTAFSRRLPFLKEKASDEMNYTEVVTDSLSQMGTWTSCYMQQFVLEQLRCVMTVKRRSAEYVVCRVCRFAVHTVKNRVCMINVANQQLQLFFLTVVITKKARHLQ